MAPQSSKNVNNEQVKLMYAPPALEAFFDLVRRLEFPELVSRYQVMFG
jgi:hypothetical protein